MMNNLEVGVKFLMYPRFVQVFINNQLGDMSHHKGILVNPSLTKKRKQRKETDETPTKEHIPTPFHDPLPSGEDRLQLNELMGICIKLSDRVLSLEQINTNQVAKIETLKKRVKKFEGLDDQEDASKQGRIAEIDADEDLSLINETAQDQGRMNDQDMFGVNDLDGDEVVVDVSAGEKE
nr:hypothetical protein [Tanacetum cinerariifolium]